jgi:hypothetical protein
MESSVWSSKKGATAVFKSDRPGRKGASKRGAQSLCCAVSKRKRAAAASEATYAILLTAPGEFGADEFGAGANPPPSFSARFAEFDSAAS